MRLNVTPAEMDAIQREHEACERSFAVYDGYRWTQTATLDELWVFLNPYRNGDEPAAEIQIAVMKWETVLTWKDHR